MNTRTSPYSPAQQNAGHRNSDGRYVWAGAVALAGTAAGTLVALWLYPIVVCALWVGVLALLGLMSTRPAPVSAG